MIAEGVVKKMRTELKDVVHYQLPLGEELVDMNALVGKEIHLQWSNEIFCKSCGNKTNKSFAQGFCFTCFSNAPENAECIIRPELCEGHLGKGRDVEWEQKHHVQPHIVYLALTDVVKVGVTRETQVPTRWIDQGAWKAIILAEVPYRQLAGLIEVALKDYVTDKTNWRKMLRNENGDEVDLEESKYELVDYLDEELQQFVSEDDTIFELNYPVLQYPAKVNSVNFDKAAEVSGILAGIRGQYLIFDDNRVINMRRHEGYKVALSVGEGVAQTTQAPTLFD